MKAVKVDQTRRIRLLELNPGDYYVAEIRGKPADEVTLRRIPPPERPRSWTKEEVLEAIDRSPQPFTAAWEELKSLTR